MFWHPTLASLLGLKTFQAVTSLLVFLWRLLEVALSLLMVTRGLKPLSLFFWCDYRRLVSQFPVSEVNCYSSSVVQNRCNCKKVHGVSTLTWRRTCHLSRMSGICNGMTVWTRGSFGDLLDLAYLAYPIGSVVEPTLIKYCCNSPLPLYVSVYSALIQKAQWFPYIPKALKDAAGNLHQGCELSWMLVDVAQSIQFHVCYVKLFLFCSAVVPTSHAGRSRDTPDRRSRSLPMILISAWKINIIIYRTPLPQ